MTQWCVAIFEDNSRHFYVVMADGGPQAWTLALVMTIILSLVPLA
jgi:hypothetical protein